MIRQLHDLLEFFPYKIGHIVCLSEQNLHSSPIPQDKRNENNISSSNLHTPVPIEWNFNVNVSQLFCHCFQVGDFTETCCLMRLIDD